MIRICHSRHNETDSCGNAEKRNLTGSRGDETVMVSTGFIAGRTATGAAWLIASRLGTRSIDIISLLVLARVLTPQDFGIVAVAMTLVQVVEAVFEIPVEQVLIRTSDVTRSMLNTAFTLSAARGLLLALLLASISFPFAAIYDDDRLAPLICFLSLAPAVRSLWSPRMTLFARTLDFRRELIIEISGKLAAFALAAACALITGSYWAIALGTVVTPVIMVTVSYLLAPFRPRLSLSEWPIFAGFLGWTTASQAVTAINWQIDWLILGGIVSKAKLGEFSMASSLAGLPEQAIIKPIVRPLLSAFSLIQTDRNRLCDAYLRTASTVYTVGLPVMLGLSVLAEPAVRLALGPKWQQSWPYLQWMALTLIPPLFTSPLGALAMALGRANIFLRQSMCELVVKLPLTLVGALWFGVYGVIVARAITSSFMALVSACLVRQLAGIPVWKQLVQQTRPLLAGGCMVAVLLPLRPLLQGSSGIHLFVGLLGIAISGLLGYGVALAAIWHVQGRPRGIEGTVLRRIDDMIVGFRLMAR
jgi:O-antigen/teichoic acid export membrane protein